MMRKWGAIVTADICLAGDAIEWREKTAAALVDETDYLAHKGGERGNIGKSTSVCKGD